MVDQFEDPITDTSYDPFGDPSGTLMKAVSVVLGIGMTLVLFGIAQSTVVPTLAGVFDAVPGVDSGQADGKIVFGGD
jgi:hypothetical protein